MCCNEAAAHNITFCKRAMMERSMHAIRFIDWGPALAYEST
jgi:hypothetical protein